MLEENLNYSDTTMAAVWPNRFAVIDPATKKAKKDEKGKNIPNAFAKALHRKPEAIANAVYSNRMGNGTIESGEGWKHRGMGLKQLTGKDNHKRCGDALGADFVSNPELLLDPKWAALSAGWFWSSNKLDVFADNDDLEGQTKKVNGGLIGIDDRKKRYKDCLASMD
jgi:putative chitinase